MNAIMDLLAVGITMVIWGVTIRTGLWWTIFGFVKIAKHKITWKQWFRRTLTGIMVIAGVWLALVAYWSFQPVGSYIEAGIYILTPFAIYVAWRETTTLGGLLVGDWSFRHPRLRFFGGHTKVKWWNTDNERKRWNQSDHWPLTLEQEYYAQQYCNAV